MEVFFIVVCVAIAVFIFLFGLGLSNDMVHYGFFTGLGCMFLIVFWGAGFAVVLDELETVKTVEYPLIEISGELYYKEGPELVAIRSLNVENVKYVESNEFKIRIEERESLALFGMQRREQIYEVFLSTDRLTQTCSMTCGSENSQSYEVLYTEQAYYSEMDDSYSFRILNDSKVEVLNLSKDKVVIEEGDVVQATLTQMGDQYQLILPRS